MFPLPPPGLPPRWGEGVPQLVPPAAQAAEGAQGRAELSLDDFLGCVVIAGGRGPQPLLREERDTRLPRRVVGENDTAVGSLRDGPCRQAEIFACSMPPGCDNSCLPPDAQCPDRDVPGRCGRRPQRGDTPVFEPRVGVGRGPRHLSPTCS